MEQHVSDRHDQAPGLATEATDALVTHLASLRASSGDQFAFARTVAPLAGAHPTEHGVRFVLWTPRLEREQVAEADVAVELLDAVDPLDLTAARATVRFRRTLVPARRLGELTVAVVDGVAVGTRDRVGCFYAMRHRGRDGETRRILDPMASSVPFGAFAPAEVYDIERAKRDRGDHAYWQRLAEQATDDRCGPGIVKQRPTTNILQLHVPTATAGGTLASLTRWYEELAAVVREGREPTPAQRAFLGYDAVQLLPVEPTTQYEAGPGFWTEQEDDGDHVVVDLARPDTTNWGYDVPIAGSATVNPTLLESGRPDELVDLAAVLHTFPGQPIRLVADVVYGHSDNQGLAVLDDEWFSGPNMYGQDMAYRQPFVRALLLEMQRRKVDFGFDAVRVDGAQDFRWWDADAGVLRHDDEFLQQMSDVVQEVAGCRHRPWMVFEDGRPWPQPDWELSSTYRAVLEQQEDDDVFQWGPLTFAHNTPFVVGFWLRSWWRIRQIMEQGSNWISGCANHDTLRRGTQVSPELYINDRLGDTRLQVLDSAYDNPAITLLVHCAFPGVPMEFLNATVRAAWGFIRNQDDRYGVKVFSEEAISLGWQVDEDFWSVARNFERLKALGFEELDELQRFADVLPALVEVTDHDLDAMARLLGEVQPPLAGPEEYTPDALKVLARAWMDDMHEYANVSRWVDRLDPRQVGFDHEVREFRRARPWLRGDLRPEDAYTYLTPVDGHAVFAVLRSAPDGGEQVLLVANMEGGPAGLAPTDVDLPGLTPDGWEVALRTPTIADDYRGGPIVLHDSTGVVLTRQR
jgi:hypothetical protein